MMKTPKQKLSTWKWSSMFSIVVLVGIIFSCNDKAVDDLMETSIQSEGVNGKVTSLTGEALPGVNILVKGTTKGTVTDVSGNYRLGPLNGNDTLIFSFINCITQYIPNKGRSVIDVVMEEGHEVIIEKTP